METSVSGAADLLLAYFRQRRDPQGKKEEKSVDRLTISPDGQLLAFAGSSGAVVLVSRKVSTHAAPRQGQVGLKYQPMACLFFMSDQALGG